MMKMTFLASVLDADGKQITFERFGCARALTVKKNMLRLFDSSLYRVCTRGAASVQVWATPDGYNLDRVVLSFPVEVTM